MGHIAYELRDAYAGTVLQRETESDPGTEVPYFTGGVINIGPDDETGDLDVRLALDEGDGVIVVEDRDPRVITALDEYAPLKRTAVPEGRESVTLTDYAGAKATTLRGELARRGVRQAGGLTKADAVAALEAFDTVAGRGENVPDGTNVDALDALADPAPEPDPEPDPVTTPEPNTTPTGEAPAGDNTTPEA